MEAAGCLYATNMEVECRSLGEKIDEERRRGLGRAILSIGTKIAVNEINGADVSVEFI